MDKSEKTPGEQAIDFTKFIVLLLAVVIVVGVYLSIRG